jgi:hypothetical protein
MKTVLFPRLAVLCALALSATTAISATFITSKVNGDDQFKIYISPDTGTGVLPFQPEGLQYANGLGWGSTFTNTLWLPQDSTGANYKTYWLNIWVQDVGGGGPAVLGMFSLTGVPGAGSPGGGSIAGCTFNNGLTTMLTNPKHWKVTKPLPQSGSLSPTGYPTWVSNYLPPWVQPTLTPTSLGANGAAPWGTQPGVSLGARWITTTPSGANFTEAWFSTPIRCP